MELDPPTPWTSMIESGRASVRLIAHPDARGIAASGPRIGGVSVVLAIGPEGGFTEDEVERAVGAGWRAVGLGRMVLRVETAALAACSTLLALAEAEPDAMKEYKEA
jgi:16S rRNA (uracil1498-N3)-methyltransferase